MKYWFMYAAVVSMLVFLTQMDYVDRAHAAESRADAGAVDAGHP